MIKQSFSSYELKNLMAYSVDFRRKVLEIKKREGLSFEAAAVRFGVGRPVFFGGQSVFFRAGSGISLR
jgi:transposase